MTVIPCGRYPLFASFKKPILNTGIQICNIFNDITVATRTTAVFHLCLWFVSAVIHIADILTITDHVKNQKKFYGLNDGRTYLVKMCGG